MRLTFPPGYLETWPCRCGLSGHSTRVPLPFSIAPVASLLQGPSLPRCPASFLSPSPGPPVSPEASSPPLEVTQILMRSGVCFRTQKLHYFILVLTGTNLKYHCTKSYRNMKKTSSSNAKESTVVWLEAQKHLVMSVFVFAGHLFLSPLTAGSALRTQLSENE